MIEYLPEVIVVGDVEMLFLGAAGALGMPKVARRILNRRYGTEDTNDEKGDELCSLCPNPDECRDNGCFLERTDE